MKKMRTLVGALVGALFLFTGCQEGSEVVSVERTDAVSEAGALQALGKVDRTQVWADDELFDSVVTPATFDPESDPFDQLYAGSFKDGVGIISEAKPGDQDYNGGRWSLNVLKADVDPGKYSDASRVEDLDLNDFESAGAYFECPLLPRRGH